MSDCKRGKNSKSTYMRQARKQRMMENQFMQEIEKAQQEAAQDRNTPPWEKNKKRSKWDDEE